MTGEPADLLVVGAGIIGAFVAYEAAMAHPDWHVVVLERSSPGSGATTWSAGADFPLAATAGHRDLVAESRQWYGRLRDTPLQSHIRPLPMYFVMHRDNVPAFSTRLVTGVRAGTAADRDVVARMLPGVRIGPEEEVVVDDTSGAVISARPLADGLLGATVARGNLAVHSGQRVEEVERQDGLYSVRAGAVRFSARRVVLAPGPWNLPGDLEQRLGGGAGTRRKRVAALHAQVPVRIGDPLVYFLDDDLFVLPLGDDSALISFHRDEWGTDPATVDGRATEQDVAAGVRVLRERCPAAADAVIGGRVFCDLYAPDRLPLVRTDAALPGLAAAIGGSGSGVRLAPGLAASALRAIA